MILSDTFILKVQAFCHYLDASGKKNVTAV